MGRWGGGPSPRNTLSRNPLQRLATSHEIEAFAPGTAQKFRGEGPPSHSAPRVNERLTHHTSIHAAMAVTPPRRIGLLLLMARSRPRGCVIVVP